MIYCALNNNQSVSQFCKLSKFDSSVSRLPEELDVHFSIFETSTKSCVLGTILTKFKEKEKVDSSVFHQFNQSVSLLKLIYSSSII